MVCRARTPMTLVAALLSSTAMAVELPEPPAGVGQSLSVPDPQVEFPLPVVDNYVNQTGENASGETVRRYDDRDNPVIEILSGFNQIWTLGDLEWADGGANGDGAKDYSNVRIVDPAVWAANMRYVLDVTGESRTPDAALGAYLDDRRKKGYSVIDGLGPLADWYREGARAMTTVDHSNDGFDVETIITYKEEDQGTGAGEADSELSDFIAFMGLMRGPEGTTSPSKYFYASPRPWRMNDAGQVIQTGMTTLGDITFETYETNVNVVPALEYVRETRGRHKDAGYPSGHTNAGYLAAIAYAYAVPERFSEMLTRASELGESRILSGMHSPLDVIGARIMATAVAAAYLNDPRLADAKAAAYKDMHDYFADRLPEATSLQAYAQSGVSDRWADDEANKELYRQRMTYSFAQDPSKAGQEMTVPKGAEVLLETRLPYLTVEQRRAVLHSTGIDSGYPVLDDSNGWGRLNLVAAADGYGAFDADVNVAMDAEQGGFHALDSWDNDISGLGRLTKNGSGTLQLTGANGYTGGTLLKGGTLVAGSATAFGTGDVFVENGTISVAEGVSLEIGGKFSQASGAVEAVITGNHAPITVHNAVAINGGTLQIGFDGVSPEVGDRFTVIAAPSVAGNFDSVQADGFSVMAEQSEEGLVVEIGEKKQAALRN